MAKMEDRELIDAAKEMLKYSYAPYSHFHVGAALLGKSGLLYTGCNVENAAYGPSNCAERTAFFKAVSEGEREFDSIAIVGGPDGVMGDYCAPCGVCRQGVWAGEVQYVLAEMGRWVLLLSNADIGWA